jgi:general secretion pathway protein G
MRSHDSKRTGLSVVELLAIVTILGLIAAIFSPRASLPSGAIRQQEGLPNKLGNHAALERGYTQDESVPINELSNVGAALDHPPNGAVAKPLSGSAYTADGTTHRVD